MSHLNDMWDRACWSLTICQCNSCETYADMEVAFKENQASFRISFFSINIISKHVYLVTVKNTVDSNENTPKWGTKSVTQIEIKLLRMVKAIRGWTKMVLSIVYNCNARQQMQVANPFLLNYEVVQSIGLNLYRFFSLEWHQSHLNGSKENMKNGYKHTASNRATCI